MILSVILLLLLGGIAYFHYAQGFFSATFSAVCAIVAAALAVGYHEVAVQSLLQGKAADYAHAMCLIAIFALVYILLRTLFDKAIPGNIRLPLMVDRLGGAAMGLVAGIFATGIIGLAAQMMPFGPSILGFARYPVETRPELAVPAVRSGGRQRDADVNEQLTEKEFVAEKRATLLLPVDDIVLQFVQMLSDGGSMAGARTLASIHPNYPDELFGQRLGIQVGAQRTAVNLPGKSPAVTLAEPVGIFRVDSPDLGKSQASAEIGQMHPRPVQWTRGPNDMQLVLRLVFTKDAADADGFARVSPASVRLVAGGKNYYPVGTMEGVNTLFANQLDDFLLVNAKAADRAADFVFFIPDPANVFEGGPKDPEQKVKDGVFVEVKRLAKIDLSGKTVKVGLTPGKNVGVERKPEALEAAKMPAAPKGGEGGGGTEGGGAGTSPASAAPGAADAPFVFSKLEIAKQIFSPVNVGTGETDVKAGQIDAGSFALQSKQFTQLDLQPTRSLQVLRQGSYTIDELFEPAGMKVVQVAGSPPPEGGDPWAWGQLRNWLLADAAGKTYPAAGALAKVKKNQADHMAASYSATPGAAPKDISAADGRPTDVWLAFLVPSGTHLKELRHQGKPITTLDQAVP